MSGQLSSLSQGGWLPKPKTQIVLASELSHMGMSWLLCFEAILGLYRLNRRSSLSQAGGQLCLWPVPIAWTGADIRTQSEWGLPGPLWHQGQRVAAWPGTKRSELTILGTR